MSFGHTAPIENRSTGTSPRPTKKPIQRLHHTLVSVIQTAVSVDADKSRFPKDWLFHHRWGKTDTTTPEGDPVEFLTVAGRTTAWVPSVQR